MMSDLDEVQLAQVRYFKGAIAHLQLARKFVNSAWHVELTNPIAQALLADGEAHGIEKAIKDIEETMSYIGSTWVIEQLTTGE